MDLKFLFQVGTEMYGIPVEVVEHTLPEVEAQPVPWMPGFHRGLFSYRGEIIPLVDIRPFLSSDPVERDLEGSILILNASSGRFATTVTAPRFLSVPDIEWPLHEQSSIHPALDQVVELEGSRFTMLNVDRLQIQLKRTLEEYFSPFHVQ